MTSRLKTRIAALEEKAPADVNQYYGISDADICRRLGLLFSKALGILNSDECAELQALPAVPGPPSSLTDDELREAVIRKGEWFVGWIAERGPQSNLERRLLAHCAG